MKMFYVNTIDEEPIKMHPMLAILYVLYRKRTECQFFHKLQKTTEIELVEGLK